MHTDLATTRECYFPRIEVHREPRQCRWIGMAIRDQIYDSDVEKISSTKNHLLSNLHLDTTQYVHLVVVKF